MSNGEATRADVCALAVAECFRDDGEIMVSAMGTTPSLGARLAKSTFAPELLMTDGFNLLLRRALPLGAKPTDDDVEGWMPFGTVFDTLWWGRRHVMMGASQIDQFGNQNIACIGPWENPKAQLLGVRGAPGNTINHVTSYWVPNHNARALVAKVDMVSGVGYDRAAALGPEGSRFHEIRRVVTNLGVFDFNTPEPPHAVGFAASRRGASASHRQHRLRARDCRSGRHDARSRPQRSLARCVRSTRKVMRRKKS